MPISNCGLLQVAGTPCQIAACYLSLTNDLFWLRKPLSRHIGQTLLQKHPACLYVRASGDVRGEFSTYCEFPSEKPDDGTVASFLSGAKHGIRARKLVDATWSQTRIPAQQQPKYRVDHEIKRMPPNELPRVAQSTLLRIVEGPSEVHRSVIALDLLKNGLPQR